MFTQASVDLFKGEGTVFRNSLDGLNVNWGMYTVADLNHLLDYHIEYTPSLRSKAKHISRWLNYHACALSWDWYEEGLEGKVTRTAINNSNMSAYTVKSEFERLYCERTCHWLNVALKFLQDNPTPIKSDGLMQ